MKSDLPIAPVLPEIVSNLHNAGRLVLVAPPGAGKTTTVPLALHKSGHWSGKIIMLEPRRIAAKAAADRMAQTLGETVGQTVGYRIKGDTKCGPSTIIEVVTEGVLTRRLQNDPELADVSAIIFDEFHERSLNADLGLALAYDIQQNLCPDLALLVMSATMNPAPVSKLLADAPVVHAEGRSFPVDVKYLDRPTHASIRVESVVQDLIKKAISETTGGILVFLPGEAEIRRVQKAISNDLRGDITLRPLLGNLPFKDQLAAIRKEQDGKRKLILSTSIAETSVTIDRITAVVDAGLARRARLDSNTNAAKLVTETVSLAEADQRAGRAGRTAPGTAYRAWAKVEEGRYPKFPPAEIEITDLSDFALQVLAWGSHPEDLSLLTPPPAKTWQLALSLLTSLGAVLDGAITPYGRVLANAPLHPRLAHMLKSSGPSAAPIAALLSDNARSKTRQSDLTPRLADARKTMGRDISRFKSFAGPEKNLSTAQMLAMAYPDRIAKRRPGKPPRFHLAGGIGAVFADDDALGGSNFVVAVDLQSSPKPGFDTRIRQAVSITLDEIRDVAGQLFATTHVCEWSERFQKLVSEKIERLGAIEISKEDWKSPPSDAKSKAILAAIPKIGLHLGKAGANLQHRATLCRQVHQDIPDLSDDALIAQLENWAAPFLNGVVSAADWKTLDKVSALEGFLGWDAVQKISTVAPAHFTTPLGRKIPIDYSGQEPAIQIRLQEMFGVTQHPTSGGTPLKVTLLSPAQRPIQITKDIPGFWAGSYADVQKDMRRQYPKHPWPDDPTEFKPTLKRK